MTRNKPAPKLLVVVAAGLLFQYGLKAQQQFQPATEYAAGNNMSYVSGRKMMVSRLNYGTTPGSMAQLFDTLKMGSVPAQISFTPGLSTQGKNGRKLINSFSLNILGGETGGVNGFELAGLFNLNRGDVRSVQVAGLFNLTPGYVEGVQIGGFYNKVGQTVQGVQIAGIHNMVNVAITGIQVAGIYNHASRVMGIQVGGIANYAKEHVKGIQVSGIANISKKVTGIQVAGIINRTKVLRGIQVGLINIADTSDGYSIGLINVVPNGYHKISFSTNEVLQVNATLKTGNKKLYSMLLAGANAQDHDKIYSFGAGLGKEIDMNNYFSVNPEISAQYVYLGTFTSFNLLNRFNLDLHLNVGRHFSVFGGPTFSAWHKEQAVSVPGYKTKLAPAGYHTFRVARNIDGWIGWNAGISFF